MPTGGRRRRVQPQPSPPAPAGASSEGASPERNETSADLTARRLQTEAIERIHAEAAASRPKNTLKQYLPRQKEWRAWCDKMAYAETARYTVTEEKLAFFLDQCVVGRAKKKGGRKKKDATAEEGEDEEGANAGVVATVSWQTVDAYIAALVDLWEEQRRAGVNSNPHPRSGAVSKIMETLRRGVAKKKRVEYHDRGIGTYLDGYNSVQQMVDMSTHLLRKNTPEGVREMAMFLIGFGGVLRGHHLREGDFADFHSVVLENMGYSRCIGLVFVLDHGKTNQSGRLEMAGMIRAKNFLTCPLFALSMHLFYEFHCANNAYQPDGQSFPSFATSPEWYDLKMFSSPKDLEEPMKYETHRSAVAKMHKATGVISKKVTHLDRGAASRMADMGGASEDSIRRAGRWNKTALNDCYLTTLPRESMRSLAQFSSSGGDFFLPRDVKVPEELLSMVFPQADAWIERQKTGDRCEPNIAANGFLLLLVELRTVLLQDMVQLRRIHPTFFLFEHPLFSSPSFLAYEQHALRTIATSDDPADMRLRQAMPVLAETMKTGFDSLMQATREQASRSEVGEQLITALATMLTDVLTGVAPVRLNAEWPRSATGQLPTFPLPSTSSAPSQPIASTSSSGSGSTQVPAATGPLATILALTGGGATPSTAATSTFAMSRSITTVADLWREYDVGVGGRASVRSQYEVKGHTWTDEAERKHFQRRMIIVRKVKQLASQHTVREVEVAARLDEFCRTSSPKVSLSKLQDLLKKDAVVLHF